MQAYLSGGPVGHCAAGQFGAVVAAQHRWISAALAGQTVELGDQVLADDTALDHPTEAFAGVFVDDGDDLDRAPVSGGIELEVHRPHPGGRIGDYGQWRGRAAVAFAPSALRHAKPFLAPKALDVLVIHCPAFGAGVVVRGSEPTSWVVVGVLAKPGSQRRIRIFRGGSGRLVALGGAVLPGDATGEPFAGPQHALTVTNGCPPAFRALKVSLRDLLERGLLQLGIGQQPFEGGVLTLKILEPFGVLGLQAAELVTSPVIGGFGDTQLAAHRRGVFTLGQKPIGRHQLAHNLFGAVPLPRCHDRVEPSCPRRGPQDSHKPWINRSESGTPLRAPISTGSALAPDRIRAEFVLCAIDDDLGVRGDESAVIAIDVLTGESAIVLADDQCRRRTVA